MPKAFGKNIYLLKTSILYEKARGENITMQYLSDEFIPPNKDRGKEANRVSWMWVKARIEIISCRSAL